MGDILKLWAARVSKIKASTSVENRPSNFDPERSNQVEVETLTRTPVLSPSSSNEQNIPTSSCPPRLGTDLALLPADPGERKPILSYPLSERDDIIRAYIQRGAAFCLYCYLFKKESLGHGGGDAFSTKGFKGWNNIERLKKHVGGPSSVHNSFSKKCEVLMMQKHHLRTYVEKQDDQMRNAYRIRLNASIDIARLVLQCGLPFRGHDESESSSKKGNFLTFLTWYSKRVDKVGAVTLKNAPQNSQMIYPSIQKDIVNACAHETIKAILEDLGDDYFAILLMSPEMCLTQNKWLLF
ncbi:uncharacterized protein [Rutidosis leptorrhynchoides]|uniref:uncharacterized protein n=1 Tax=Rutidosis leptorrhynchoides TaxID=125765 RepID=UPI003A990526